MYPDKKSGLFRLEGSEPRLINDAQRTYPFHEADTLLARVLAAKTRHQLRDLTSLVPGGQLNAARDEQQASVQRLEQMAEVLMPYAAPLVVQAIGGLLESSSEA
jgi:hypothetical protein